MSLHLHDDYEEPSPHHTELTLSSSMLLGLAFVLVLLCALFFGLGYSMHRPRTVPLPELAAQDSTPNENFNNFKPAAGSPLNAPAKPVITPAPLNVATPTPLPSAVTPKPVVAPATSKPTAAVAATTPSPTPTPIAPPAATSGFYVQVAAVSHQQEAQTLVDALHAKGYLVTSRTSSQDTLFHVQIGPYATHKDADLIRQKLAGEGYSAIVK